MKIRETISLLEKSIGPGSEKDEIKNKVKLISVLRELEMKDLTVKQNLLLEEQLTLLFEEEGLKAKNIKEKKQDFYSFLEKKLFMKYKGYWKAFGAFMGSALGFIGLTLAMVLLDSYSSYFVAPVISLMIGLIIGLIMDLSLEKQGRTISTWP